MSHMRNHPFGKVVATSDHWKKENEEERTTTECCTVILPEREFEDMSITFRVGRKEGIQLLNKLQLKRTWSTGV